ncbi:helix-turn-helix domain-containing protein [Winogradskya consettensis]|uniref:Transcriptional regulator n=1 Tax=Winogradskya consettensis TaxID=113560 RepID=A0A919SY32_9ACTN|nr:DJ-1/PfpI family protein [Actinoplanes consettensis]GIM79472.1 transcriptional regulator [Actinoplanes consettensis]
MSQVVFVLVPGLHLLDLAGAAQVFSTAAEYGHDYRPTYVAEHEQITTHQGVTLLATKQWPDLTPDDLVVVPGWSVRPGTTNGHLQQQTLDRLTAHHTAGGTVASICAGADALGRAGLLNGRRCTTHHDIQHTLARRYPLAEVIPDVLYVTDGRVVTSAGIASGIDLALHLVATHHGPAAAARVARQMVVYARRNGNDSQQSAMLRHRAHLSDAVHRVQDRIETDFKEQLPLTDLARTAGISERTLTRRFESATGSTPLRYQQLLRLERAEHLISHGATIESAAHSVGFTDARMLRRLRSRPH